MPFPTDNGTIPTSMSGGTLLADAIDDHAQAHRQIGTVVNNLSTALGTTPGTNILGLFIDAAGEFAPAVNASGVFQDTMTGGTFNSMVFGTSQFTGGTIGTATLTGGTINGQVVNGGTIANGVYGTAQHTGGTLTTPVINGGTYGTINAPASKDLILTPAAGSVMQGGYQRQGGTNNDYSVGGTTGFAETGVFMQFGMGTMTGNGTPAAGGTVSFPIAYSEVPLVFIVPFGTQASLPAVNTLTAGSFTINSERNLTVGIQWFAIGKR